MTDLDSLREAELRFQTAQVASDVAALDEIEHPDLTFIGPDGGVHDKAGDLAAHASGAMQVDGLETETLLARVSDGVGITTLIARMTGRFHNDAFDTKMVYTRTWAHGPSGWRIVSAHISQLG